MLIFRSMGLKCIPFLPQIMPPFLQCMRQKDILFLKFLFKQLGMLVAIVKQHIRVSLPPFRWLPPSVITNIIDSNYHPFIVFCLGSLGRDLYSHQGVLEHIAT